MKSSTYKHPCEDINRTLRNTHSKRRKRWRFKSVIYIHRECSQNYYRRTALQEAVKKELHPSPGGLQDTWSCHEKHEEPSDRIRIFREQYLWKGHFVACANYVCRKINKEYLVKKIRILSNGWWENKMKGRNQFHIAYHKNVFKSPGWALQLVGALSPTAKGHRLDHRSEQIPRFWVWAPFGHVQEATNWCFSLTWRFSLFLSLSPFLSLKISKHILGWGFKKTFSAK